MNQLSQTWVFSSIKSRLLSRSRSGVAGLQKYMLFYSTRDGRGRKISADSTMAFLTFQNMGFPTQKESARSVQPFLSYGASKVHAFLRYQGRSREENFIRFHSGFFDTPKHGLSNAKGISRIRAAVSELWGFKSTCISTVPGTVAGGKFHKIPQ